MLIFFANLLLDVRIAVGDRHAPNAALEGLPNPIQVDVVVVQPRTQVLVRVLRTALILFIVSWQAA